MYQMASRPFVDSVLKAMNIMHTDRKDIVTGGKFPHVPSKKPVMAKLEQGETYLWCSCGHSKTQPFCDKSHFTTGTSYRPLKFTWEQPT